MGLLPGVLDSAGAERDWQPVRGPASTGLLLASAPDQGLAARVCAPTVRPAQSVLILRVPGSGLSSLQRKERLRAHEGKRLDQSDSALGSGC